MAIASIHVGRKVGSAPDRPAERQQPAKPSKPRFHLTIEAPMQFDDPSGCRRLRLFLKRLGRAYGLRCVDARRENEPKAGP